MFGDFPVIFLLLISSFTPLWPKKTLCMISIILNQLWFVLSPSRYMIHGNLERMGFLMSLSGFFYKWFCWFMLLYPVSRFGCQILKNLAMYTVGAYDGFVKLFGSAIVLPLFLLPHVPLLWSAEIWRRKASSLGRLQW